MFAGRPDGVCAFVFVVSLFLGDANESWIAIICWFEQKQWWFFFAIGTSTTRFPLRRRLDCEGVLRLGNRGRQPRAIDRVPQFQDLPVVLLVRIVRVCSVLRNVTTGAVLVVVVVPPPDQTRTVVEDLKRHVLALAVARQLEVDPGPVPRILFHRIGGPVRIRNDGGRGGRR